MNESFNFTSMQFCISFLMSFDLLLLILRFLINAFMRVSREVLIWSLFFERVLFFLLRQFIFSSFFLFVFLFFCLLWCVCCNLLLVAFAYIRVFSYATGYKDQWSDLLQLGLILQNVFLIFTIYHIPPKRVVRIHKNLL